MSAHQPLCAERAKMRRLARQQNQQISPRDLQDLMAYPFFSLAKTPRLKPISYCTGGVSIDVSPSSPLGIATIWDADILIYAISKIMRVRNAGQDSSPKLRTTPHEILSFIGRDHAQSGYRRLKASLARLQNTKITTSLRASPNSLASFAWIDSWQDLDKKIDRSASLEITLSNWLYASLAHDNRVLTLSPDYFSLTGGMERWLYRLVRKHGGRQLSGWEFEFRHLFLKAGSSQQFRYFSRDIRNIVHRQPLPGYHLDILVDMRGNEILSFRSKPCGQQPATLGQSHPLNYGRSHAHRTGNGPRESTLNDCRKSDPARLNFYSNFDSNFIDARPVDKPSHREERKSSTELFNHLVSSNKEKW